MRRARVSRFPPDTIYTVELELVREARPTMAELGTIFGKRHGSRFRDDHGQRYDVFYPPSKGRRWSVAVIANLLPCFDWHSKGDPPPWPCTEIADDSLVETVDFRRDPKS
jgi:hypothetical protein